MTPSAAVFCGAQRRHSCPIARNGPPRLACDARTVALIGGFRRTLSRWRIAFMAPELARSLAESQRRTIELALEKLGGEDADQSRLLWSQRLEAAMEALSRFVLRLNPKEVESVLQLARSLYGDPLIRARVQYFQPLANLLRRSWEALPAPSRAEHALDLFSLPITGVDGFSVDVDMENHFRDPGYIIDTANSDTGLPCARPVRSQ